MVHREDSYGAETLTLPEGTPEGQYLVTIELLPYEKLPDTSSEKPDDTAVTKSDEKSADISQELDNNRGEKPGSSEEIMRGESKEDKETDKDSAKESKSEESLREDKEESNSQLQSQSQTQPSSPLPVAESKVQVPVPALPESGFSCNYSSSRSRSRESVRERFGIVQGEGSVWVEWLVNTSRGGSVSVGAMTAAAAGDPDARCVLDRVCVCVICSVMFCFFK